MIYIGVDPGSTGAIALFHCPELFQSRQEVFDFDSPDSLAAIKIASEFNTHAVVEKVNAMPKQGVSTTFKFGTAYGKVLGWLEACQIPYELVTPAKWKKAMFDSMPKQDDKKAMALDLARRLFPDIAANRLARKKDHNRAEALLIAEFCRRNHV